MFGFLIPAAVTLSSLILLIKMRFFVFCSFFKIIGCMVRTLRARQARRSFLLALSGTLGVGNIVGVAVGILIGGAGSVFWLVISSFFSMILKYAEASLSSQTSLDKGYGIISLIHESYPKIGCHLSKIYAVFCIGLSFFMGAALQSSSVCSSVSRIVGLNGFIVGVFLCVFIIVAVVFKSRGIISAVSWLLPIASFLYMTLCCICIFKGINNLSAVLLNIIGSSFNFSSFGAGAFGYLIASGIKEGFSRGLLSNEAGAGTSTLAHGTNTVSSASNVGILGMGEVVVDTLIFCPLTALAILVNVPDGSVCSTGIELIMASLGKAFIGADGVLSVCIFVFAYATIICWFYYGNLAVKYVFGRGTVLFGIIYLASVLLGGVIGDVFAVKITDIILFCLTVITCTTLIKRSGSLVELSERSGLIKPHLKSQAKPSLHPRK